jgi:hypothetical protein
LRGWGAGEKNELSIGWVSSSWGTFRSSVMNPSAWKDGAGRREEAGAWGVKEA